MLSYKKEKFEENFEDIMASVNEILNKTGDGFESNEEKIEWRDGNEKDNSRNENRNYTE